MWVISLIGAAVIIQVIEYLNRNYGQGWLHTLMLTGPLIILAQAGLYYGWKYTPHVMVGWACFSLTNSFLRVGMVHYLYHDRLTLWHLAGTICVMLGMWCMTRH